jgi:hypothetical protein
MQDVPSFFWRKWLKADDHMKEEMVKDLKVTKLLASLLYPKLDTEHAIDAAAIMMNSYFEDLAEHILADQSLPQ